MQENQLFEYAVIRVVPRVEREEFINVGVILLCTSQKFLKAKIELRQEKLKALGATVDLTELDSHIRSLERICAGGESSGPIGQLTLPERFRWLTSSRSTILQTSKVHPGLCVSPEAKLHQLFDELVADVK